MVDLLLGYPTTTARHMRNRLWEALVRPAMENDTPLDEVATEKFLGTLADGRDVPAMTWST